MGSVPTKVNISALLDSETKTGQTVGQILTDLEYPVDSLHSMYSFQQILELDTIKTLLASQGVEMPPIQYR